VFRQNEKEGIPEMAASPMTGCDSLESAVATGREIFGRLRQKYPDLKAYLVLAHRSEQIGLTSSPMDLLTNCPGMVVDDDAKREALRLQTDKKRLETAAQNDIKRQRVDRELAERLKALRFLPEVQIEIRFEGLKYTLIHALREDPLVDRDLTPQTRASIRIVLGNLATLSAL
jgi:hypothetical protein